MPSIHVLVTAQVVCHAAKARCKSKLHHWDAIWSTLVHGDVVLPPRFSVLAVVYTTVGLALHKLSLKRFCSINPLLPSPLTWHFVHLHTCRANQEVGREKLSIALENQTLQSECSSPDLGACANPAGSAEKMLETTFPGKEEGWETPPWQWDFL